MKQLLLSNVTIPSGFWADYQTLVRDTVIPFQYKALHDAVSTLEPSGAIRNFRIAAGLEDGAFYGMVFQDSDVAKWLEAVAYSLATHPDPALEQQADEVIALLEKAQQPDGYLNTYYIIGGLEQRFTNLKDCHELYCLGHLIEAAVAYYESTGKDTLLNIVCRFTNLVDQVFGPAPHQKKGYPGHQEIELALVRLYHVTKEQRYLDLSAFFINQRGKQPHYFFEEYEARGRTGHWSDEEPNLLYNQSHLPVRQQSEAVGHAVRALYMYAAMADLAHELADNELLHACETLWNTIVTT